MGKTVMTDKGEDSQVVRVQVAQSLGVPECSGSGDVKASKSPRFGSRLEQSKTLSFAPLALSPITTNMNDTASISRATSISRASKQGSTISRSQSLIKKNIAPHDLRPSDVLIDRFVAWKAIVKQLVAFFEVPFFSSYTPQTISYVECQGIADIENNTAKEMTKLAAVIQVPFRSANQFLGEGGLQVRDPHSL